MWITLSVVLVSFSVIFQKSEFLLFTPVKCLLTFFLVFRDCVKYFSIRVWSSFRFYSFFGCLLGYLRFSYSLVTVFGNVFHDGDRKGFKTFMPFSDEFVVIVTDCRCKVDL